MSIGLLIVIVVAAVALIVKRFQGEPMNARDTFATPLILVAIGIFSVIEVEDLDGTDLTWLISGGIVGVTFGAVRGTTIGLFERDGHLWQRYTVQTVAVWAVSMAAGFGVETLGTAMGMHHDARPTTLSIGIGMVGEMLTLGFRALSTGVPFAPDKDSSRASDRSTSPLDRYLGKPSRPAPDRRHPGEQERRPHRSPTLPEGFGDGLNQARDRR
ncbi:hypothetical protein [Nocardia sp. NPDC051463]|uniref:hypothetical protein n=1 Tax=Nocardia sp. NPDC051463 TaxID=3154845 RepID=UPI00344F5993